MSVTAISIPPRLSSLAKVRRKCLHCKRESTPSWGLFAPVHRQAPHTSRDRTGTELSSLQLSSQQCVCVCVCVCVSGEEWVAAREDTQRPSPSFSNSADFITSCAKAEVRACRLESTCISKCAHVCVCVNVL
ncbi:hypothetical protein ILYODFUR_010404 [Ilyodon furcidens]|uniref:Uncharacterized protein n=1 Tax=Ilyodon furcidens TaxID=33524 RepID=A0ABV0SK23_9TELE